MSSSDPDSDAGEQWREGLPSNWLECRFHPPLECDDTGDVEVYECDTATFLRLQDSATSWLKADNEEVLSPEEYR